MKWLVVAITAIVIQFGLVGCGGGGSTSPGSAGSSDGGSAIPTATAPVVDESPDQNVTTGTAVDTATVDSSVVADAGPDQNIHTASKVTLDGASSIDTDGDVLEYQWKFKSKPSGSNATLSDESSVRASFVPDVDGAYVCELTVKDEVVDSAIDTVTITATTDNAAPVAHAGPDQHVYTTSLVILDGSKSSDADRDTMSCKWNIVSKPAGSSATLSDTTSAKPTFEADRDGAYVFELTVDDGTVKSAPDRVTITASTENSAPVACAGPDKNVNTGSTVILDGSKSSDADHDLMSCKWSIVSKPAGSSATLSDTTSARPTFVADADGFYVIKLIANDGTVDSAPDTVTIMATTANSAPEAHAGPDKNINTGSTVTLDGSASCDADRDTLTYSWCIASKPQGSNAKLSNVHSVRPKFTADRDGTYVFKLRVNDGTVDSIADTVTITATTANSAPEAHAGSDKNVNTGSNVTLDGSESCDADRDTLTYSWCIASKPQGSNAKLSNVHSVRPTFVADRDGAYVFELTVNDGKANSVPDTVTITASSANVAPIAKAGPDQNVNTGTTVTLDASGSSDADNDTLTYNWSFVSKPSGSNAKLSSVHSVRPTFVVDVEGSYVFHMRVNDGKVDSVVGTVTITATTIATDTTPPVITLNGANSIEVIQNGTFKDPGATATDDIDGTVSVTASGIVDTSIVGSYTLTYTATDSAGNTATRARTVNVVAATSTDTTPPAITLNGANPIAVTQGASYTEAGASATDDKDGTVVVTIAGNVDTSALGTYTITYTATDIAGNTAIKTRTVNVVLPPDITPPIITLNGDFTVMLTQGDSYTEAGATATDERDGSVLVTTSGTVDMATVGRYILTYSATDSAGNSASKNRTVYVTMPPEQVETLPFDFNKVEGYESGMDESMVAGSIKNQYWIRAHNRLTEAELRQIVTEYGELSVIGYSDIHGLLVEIPEDSYEAMVALKTIELKKGITSVRQRVYMGSGLRSGDSIIPDDGGSPLGEVEPEGDNWHLDYIHMPEAWEITTGNEEVLIGIADGGFYLNHEDIFSSFDHKRFRLTKLRAHGTAVAGIIAADTNNSIGISGINWKSKLIVTDISSIDVRNADIIFKNIFEVNKVKDPKVKLINNSWGYKYWLDNTNDKKSEENGIKFTRANRNLIENYNGKLFIFAAGNEGMDAKVTNGALHLNDDGFVVKKENLIVVAALLKNGNLPAYSCYGETVDIAAPTSVKAPKSITSDDKSTYFEVSDTTIYGTDHDSAYDDDGDREPLIFNGTSASAPVVTGVASLIYSLSPDFTPQEVKDILIKSSSSFATERHETSAYDEDETTEDIRGNNKIPILDARAALQRAKNIIDGKVLKVTYYYPSAFSQAGNVFTSSANAEKLKLENLNFVVSGQNEDGSWEDISTKFPTSTAFNEADKEISFDADIKYIKYRIKGVANYEGLPVFRFSEEFENNIREIRQVSIIDKATVKAIEGATITIESKGINYLSAFEKLVFQKKTLVDSSEVTIYLEKDKAYKVHVTKEGYKEYRGELNSYSNLDISMVPLDAKASGTVHGQVFYSDSDNNSKSIINARVELFSLGLDGKNVQTLRTGEFGQYTIRDIDILDENGDYIIYDLNVSKAGYISDQKYVVLVDGSTVTEDFTLEGIEGYINTPPVALAQGVTTAQDVPLPITLSGSDVDDDPLDYVIVSQPHNGTLSGIAPNVTYTPNSGYNGSDSFTFKVNDGLDDSAIVSVDITIDLVSAPTSKIKKTGKTISYNDFDDGYYQKGINPFYTRDDTEGIVTDNVTELEWQDNTSTSRNWSDALTYCSNLDLGNNDDWRLPSRNELMTILQYGENHIDPIFINYTDYYHWTRSTPGGDASNYGSKAWYIHFGNNASYYSSKTNNFRVRCVRGTDVRSSTSGMERSGSTVMDKKTKLMWEDTPQTKSESQKKTLQNAISYCENLNLDSYDDWRLPNVKELLSIVVDYRYDTAISSTFSYYPQGATSWSVIFGYWSSTSNGSSNSWIVDFLAGGVNAYSNTLARHVRCVRSD